MYAFEDELETRRAEYMAGEEHSSVEDDARDQGGSDEKREKNGGHNPELQVRLRMLQGRACFLPAPVLTAAVTGTAGISIPGIMGGTIPGIYGYKEDKK